MKKVLALMLTLVLVLSLAACGGGENSTTSEKNNSNNIEITLDNYNNYLNVGGIVLCKSEVENALHVGELNGGKGLKKNDTTYAMVVWDTVILSAGSEGKSQNFNYNDIKVAGKLTCTCKTFENKKDNNGLYAFTGSEIIEREISFDCDITGQGSYYEEVKLSNGAYTSDTDNMITYNFEITSISGTVTPA